MATRTRKSSTSIFINCPFTDDYTTLFHAMVFTVLTCGFRPRSALEQGDGGEIRMDKIIRLIKSSPYSIHDLSAVALDSINALPRFNMPFELGLTLGLKAAGGKQAKHRVLILERDRFTYQNVSRTSRARISRRTMAIWGRWLSRCVTGCVRRRAVTCQGPQKSPARGEHLARPCRKCAPMQASRWLTCRSQSFWPCRCSF